MGLLDKNYFDNKAQNKIDEEYILAKIEQRNISKKNKNYTQADNIRDELLNKNIIIKDGKGGTSWELKN